MKRKLNAKELIKTTFIYSVLGFLPAASRFFLFPVFVKYLSPRDYGLIGLNATVVGVLTIFIAFGLDDAYSRYYFDYRKNAKMLNAYTSTMFLVMLGIGAGLTMLLIPFGNLIHSFVFKDATYSFFPYGLISLVMALFACLNALIFVYYRNQKEPLNYLYFALGLFIFSVSSEFVAVVFLHADGLGVLYARLLGTSLFSVIYWFRFFYSIKLNFDKRFVFPSLKYGAPFVMYGLFGFLYISYDRILIANHLSLADLGVYNIAFTIASVVEITLQTLQLAVQPDIYYLYKQGGVDNHNRVDKLYRFIGIAVLIMMSAIMSLTPLFIERYTRPVYHFAETLIPVMMIGFIARYLYAVYSMPLFYFKETRKLPWINLIAGGISITLNLLLLPVIGLFGGAVSMSASRIGQVPFAFFWAKKAQGGRAPGLGVLNVIIFLCVLGLLLAAALPIHSLVKLLACQLPAVVLVIYLGSVLFKNRKHLQVHGLRGMKEVIINLL
jgi:O-antigen/teichoic acid export membrane protein